MHEYAILCPGQGSQTPQMFDMVVANVAGRDVVETFSDMLKTDLVARARSGDRLFDNDFAQPAIVALACGTWAALSPWLPTPLAFAGYSVGELSAWSCAGALDTRVAAAAAQARALAMTQHAPQGCGMLATGGLPVSVLCSHANRLHLAIVNDRDHIVLSGTDADMVQAQERLSAHGAWTRRLDVHVPSHTPLLAAAASEFSTWLLTVPTRQIAAPIIRGIDGRRCLDASYLCHALSRAICETIRWDDCRREITECGGQILLELGPGRALTRLADHDDPRPVARSTADFRSLDAAAEWLMRQLET
jgi:[acyl-carrier-protein] S-malonyltransferase